MGQKKQVGISTLVVCWKNTRENKMCLVYVDESFN